MEKFSNLPAPIKWVLGATGIGALVGTGSALTSGKWAFLLILLILLVVVLGGYLLWMAWRRKKRNAQLGGELAQHSAASPRGISDPGQRARLDDLRKKFETGVTEYRSRGKDLYKLPWYVIVGEPGSGKTEAVRHSNVGFPPGMQDEFQGVGGTINMNWWFTNHAVLLDTAGRLMFEEVKPGETSEWKEFLTLLKKNRPNCPINGLFLVIPSDSLIKDSAEDIARKAGKIAQQLDVIQRVLDVRFPVFVIVTKCDKIVGFREFFDGLNDPQLQHQMMGWSNPDALDTAFRPELVDQHLEKVVHRLRRRRLGLLRDPVCENPSGRRTDEVDSLYALPHSLSTLAPRMRRYLETIFIAGEWSAKPLFLRGIYFSSSMREGSALDEELAQALSIPVDDLPEGKVWERDRAFFLRDLFIEKVFKERGLVTRASNTSRMLRAQQVALFGFVLVALAIFVSVAWLGKTRLEQDVEYQSRSWVLATNWWGDKTWKQSIIPRNADGSYADYATNRVEIDHSPYELGALFLKLQEMAATPLKRNWMLAGLADDYNRNSKRAVRIVFEGGVVRPLVEATRGKMLRGSPGSLKGEPEVLATLVRLESDVLSAKKGTNWAELDAEAARGFLAPLLVYVTGQERPIDATTFSNLVSVMVWTYSIKDQALENWPPSWLSESSAGATNSTILVGLNHCSRTATNTIQEQLTSWSSLNPLRDALGQFEKSETKLFQAAQGNDSKAVDASYDALDQARKALADQMEKNAGSTVFQDRLLTNAFARFRQSVELSSTNLLAGIERANSKGRREHPESPLFQRIQAQLVGYQSSLGSAITQLVPAREVEDMKRLDERYLGNSSYAARWGSYEMIEKLGKDKLFQAGTLVNSRGEQLEQFITNKLAQAKSAAARYAGPFATEFNLTVNSMLAGAEKSQRDLFASMYVEEAGAEVKKFKRFPLVRSLSQAALTKEELSKADAAVDKISKDLASSAFQRFPAKEYPGLASLSTQMSSLNRVLRAIFVGNTDTPGGCVISLVKMSTDDFKTADQWREVWHDIKMVCAGSTPDCQTTGTQRTADGKDTVLGTLKSIDQEIGIQLITTAAAENRKESPYKTDPWGPLRLVCQYAPSTEGAPPADLSRWMVLWPLKGADGAGTIRLILQFDRALPDLKSWPTE